MDKNIIHFYAKFLENIKRPDIECLEHYVSKDIHFRDPFNDCIGLEQFQAVLSDMFIHLESFQFQVTDCIFSEEQRVGYLQWNMAAKSKHLRNKDLTLEGVTQVTFNSEGKVSAHFDYWDAASGLYEKIPIINFILKKIRKRISSTYDR